MPLSNTRILEEIRKVIDELSIVDDNNVTTATFSHASNTQRDNSNVIFTSEKPDKSDKLVYTVNNLTINDAKYYESNTATASAVQGSITRNTETVTHTSTRNLNKTYLVTGSPLSCAWQ